jgi:ADP-ribose pyrophosphatase YjhB (NUDIX family)
MGIGCARLTVNEDMNLRIKHSVAVAIFKDDKILATYRPEDDDELPGVWGLPAGTCRGTETPEDVIRRIGRDKLGVMLQPVRLLASGDQDRPDYKLEMELWEASMKGEPTHPKWMWSGLESLVFGAAKGSLCCALALKHKSRVG